MASTVPLGALNHGGVAQDVMNAPAAFARLKPIVALARRTLRSRRSLCLRIKQPKGGVQMCQVDAVLLDMTPETFERFGNLRAFCPQIHHDQRFHYWRVLHKAADFPSVTATGHDVNIMLNIYLGQVVRPA